MRNTTMQDALTAILLRGSSTQLENQTDEAVLSAVRSTRRKFIKTHRKPAIAFESGNQKEAGIPAFAPRYVDPRRKNPFSVHTHPIVSVSETVEEEVSEPEEASPVSASVLKMDKPETATSREDLCLSSKVEIPAAKEPISISGQEPENESIAPISSVQSFPAEKPIESETPVKPETPVVCDASEEEKQMPSVVLPSNLQWLQKSTPFSANLAAIVDELRDARQRVIFTLEQHQARQKEFRKQLDAAEYGIAEQQENLRQLDDTISACALVAEQSGSLNPALLAVNSLHHRQNVKKPRVPGTTRRWSADDATMCHQKDIVQFFEINANTNWTAPEIIKLLPAAKHKHAKGHLNIILSALYKMGKIRRVSNGIYRMDMAEKQNSESRE